ncbi:mucin-2-like [Sycon ciliatum]|uniref:mucin-2-like n=1 Tax=Sycon ciliatum TaxID=27933 RepID=UPI0031F67F9F
MLYPGLRRSASGDRHCNVFSMDKQTRTCTSDYPPIVPIVTYAASVQPHGPLLVSGMQLSGGNAEETQVAVSPPAAAAMPAPPAPSTIPIPRQYVIVQQAFPAMTSPSSSNNQASSFPMFAQPMTFQAPVNVVYSPHYIVTTSTSASSSSPVFPIPVMQPPASISHVDHERTKSELSSSNEEEVPFSPRHNPQYAVVPQPAFHLQPVAVSQFGKDHPKMETSLQRKSSTDSDHSSLDKCQDLDCSEENHPAAPMGAVQIDGVDTTAAAAAAATSSQAARPAWMNRQRIRFTVDQTAHLEDLYKVEQYPSLATRKATAAAFGLPEKSVRVWFQNKRAREKLLPGATGARMPAPVSSSGSGMTAATLSTTTSEKPVLSATGQPMPPLSPTSTSPTTPPATKPAS